ncbi:bile acid:sodium symporter family protein [Peribacillus butanolivorans]|uniref:bile acid:sodium symporter family protein n=1 Tax=Peribacillus butanolivorans TaxID=421767 RepID=UPI003669465A
MMLKTINKQMDKAMPLITPISVVIGVLLAEHLTDYTFLVPWIFAFITFAGSLGSNFKSLQRVVTHPLPVFIVLIILHVLMPIWAWALGHLVFRGDAFTITGLILSVVIPTGVTSMIWVSIYKGNAVLALTIILIDTLLSPFIVPYSVALFGGGSIEMDMWSMVKGLIGMVVLPSMLAMFLNQTTKGKIKTSLSPRLAPFSKLSVGIVVILNSSKIAPYLTHFDKKLIIMTFLVLFIATSGYALSWIIGKLLKWEKEDVITLTFTGGMRNISAGAVLATTYFPAAVAVPVVLGMLFQQMLASFFGYSLDKYYHRRFSKIKSDGLFKT